ncbi:MAG: ferredoxin [Thermofilum sp. ex4484_15]|nr:MAG: ferredoxin [Thermofilum sp. ex4484_15]
MRVITPIAKPKEGSAGLTGKWRIFKPVINYSKCNNCGLCWLYCPEAAITLDGKNVPKIVYEYCKGCGICANECPVRAIDLIKEE